MRYIFSMPAMLMLIGVIASGSTAQANPDIPPSMPSNIGYGTIELATCGELDPFELGDACVVYGYNQNGAAFGLVTDLRLLERYGYAGLESLAGQPVSLYADSLRVLDDVAVLAVLNSLPFTDTEGRLFYWWDGTGDLGN